VDTCTFHTHTEVSLIVDVTCTQFLISSPLWTPAHFTHTKVSLIVDVTCTQFLISSPLWTPAHFTHTQKWVSLLTLRAHSFSSLVHCGHLHISHTQKWVSLLTLRVHSFSSLVHCGHLHISHTHRSESHCWRYVHTVSRLSSTVDTCTFHTLCLQPLYMASESLLKTYFSIFLRNLKYRWPWISLRGHSRLYILLAVESQCTTLYRPLTVTFALSSTVYEILPVLYAQSQFFPTPLFRLKFGVFHLE